MPVVSAPCSCQPDCLVCGRGDVPPHNCAIHVLLESMVFQEHMLYGEPTEERLEEILQNGKEYLPLAMHMTDQNSRIGVADQSDHHFLDIFRVRAFARSEPKDVSSDYVKQEASKGAFIQALWMPNPAYTVWHIRLIMVRKNLTTWTLLAQAVDVMQRNGPIPCFKSPTYAPSVRCTGQKRHAVAMSFTCNVRCNTWM
ncbi:uncharacterized protein TNCV_1765571 [Trichonephila clavipes]|nr:uncharacterized protein TNCV_1765571 [Trichonephila clavipes]